MNANLPLDGEDPFEGYRAQFHLPLGEDGQPLVYLCGHSLGLQPRHSRDALDQVMEQWREQAVEHWFAEQQPWYAAGDRLRPSLARLVGALPEEVTVMNSLTVNMHLLLASFYQPNAGRRVVITDAPTFPSDLHALRSQMAFKGSDPDTDLVLAHPRPGEATLRTEDIEQLISDQGDALALVWLSGVNFLTGQLYDLPAIAKRTRDAGALIGLDLAHAIGNVPLKLHEWGVDCAVWCHYKYLNSGPGSVGGAFVHQRHYEDTTQPRLAGWWGDRLQDRFDRHVQPDYVPEYGASGWQVSTPSPMQAAVLRASLDLFDQAGIDALRSRSKRLTAQLEQAIDDLNLAQLTQLTPRDPEQRGAQLSYRVDGDATALQTALRQAGIVCDVRAPNVLRVAPCPLYTSFEDLERCATGICSLFR